MNVLVLDEEQAKLETTILDQILLSPNTGKKGSILQKDETRTEHYIIDTKVQLMPLTDSHIRINQMMLQAKSQNYHYLMIKLSKCDKQEQ